MIVMMIIIYSQADIGVVHIEHLIVLLCCLHLQFGDFTQFHVYVLRTFEHPWNGFLHPDSHMCWLSWGSHVGFRGPQIAL